MPSTVSWPEMGGATEHPTGAALALGDPSVSLNAPQRSRGYHRLQGVPGLAPWVAVWLVHVPVAAAGAATEFGQDSGMRSGLPLSQRKHRSGLLSDCRLCPRKYGGSSPKSKY